MADYSDVVGSSPWMEHPNSCIWRLVQVCLCLFVETVWLSQDPSGGLNMLDISRWAFHRLGGMLVQHGRQQQRVFLFVAAPAIFMWTQQCSILWKSGLFGQLLHWMTGPRGTCWSFVKISGLCKIVQLQSSQVGRDSSPFLLLRLYRLNSLDSLLRTSCRRMMQLDLQAMVHKGPD